MFALQNKFTRSVRAIAAAAAVTFASVACTTTEDVTRISLRPTDLDFADTLAVANGSDTDVTLTLVYADGESHEVIAAAGGKSRHELPRGLLNEELSVEMPGSFRGSIELETLCTVDCLAAGTQVLTPTGLRGIETLGAGDVVVTDVGERTVLERRSATARRVIELSLGGEVLQASCGHRFETAAGWRRADALAAQDRLRTASGEFVTLSRRDVVRSKGGTVVHSLILNDDAALVVATSKILARRAREQSSQAR